MKAKKVIRACKICKDFYWIFEKDNKPLIQYVCENCKLEEIKNKL